jgi:maleylpyruvate isomerase
MAMDSIGQREQAITGALSAQRRLLDGLAHLTDEQARSASLLPGWSVGHVLTHIARNGDSYTRMMSAALEGRAVTQYEGGREQRAADIEAGADRTAAELVADVTGSAASVEDVWSRMTPESWAGHGLKPEGDVWECEAMPFHRWREVIVHHADLGLGFTAADWPAEYVERDLFVSLQSLPDRLNIADQRRMLTWLLGRSEQPADLSPSPWQFRAEHYLR